jgi:hypothetical protein
MGESLVQTKPIPHGIPKTGGNNTGPTVNNLAGGVFHALSDAPFTRFNSSAVLNNAGTFRKLGGSRTKTMNVVFA